MSNLDLVQQETISLSVNQIHQDLPDMKDESLNQVNKDLLDAWREVFAQDKVQVTESCCC